MASFMRRGLGRVTGATGPLTQVGSGAGVGPLVDVASTNISVPGVSGTQFAYITGEALLFTNSTRALACTGDPGSVCNVQLYLYDGDTQLAESLIRISADRDGGTLSVSAVQSVSAGATKTYTLRAQTFNVNTNEVFVGAPRIIAATFPFGGTGGSTITVAPPATGPGPTRGNPASHAQAPGPRTRSAGRGGCYSPSCRLRRRLRPRRELLERLTWPRIDDPRGG